MTPLRKPTDADNYRVQAGRFGDRFYCDPLPADDLWEATGDNDIYPAISTVKKASGSDWAPVMAKRLSKAPSQLVEIGNLTDEFERKERIKLLDKADLGQASDRGTAVHAYAEALLENRMPVYQMSDLVKPYIRTVDAFFAAYNPKPMAMEFVAINRHMNSSRLDRGNKYSGYGGTGDAVLEIEGELWLVDWKSRGDDSNHGAYPEEGAQAAAYGKADYWIVGDPTSPNGAKRITPPELAGGLIVSIKSDSYECYPIDLDEGFEFWTDLHAWWQGKRSERRCIGRKWAPRVTPETEAAPAPTPEPTVEPVVEPEPATSQIVEPVETEPATPTSNRKRFDALDEPSKARIREIFKSRKLNPNNPATAEKVAWFLSEIEQRPSLREMQETSARQRQESMPVTKEEAPPELTEEELLAIEGGPAPEGMVAESKLMFDMVFGPEAKEWTSKRVKEANESDVSFQLSKLSSLHRANLYLALTRWCEFRQESDETAPLTADEVEGNLAFTGFLSMVDGLNETDLDIGTRLGMLSPTLSEKLTAIVTDVVRSEIGDKPVTETQTEPAGQPAGKSQEAE